MDTILSFSFEHFIPMSLTTLICIGLLYIYYFSKNKHQYWSEKGIGGPKPVPLLGNLLSLLTGNRLKKELEWIERYGKLYGIYIANEPHLIVADPEIITQICVKDFEVFPNHNPMHFGHKYLISSLFAAKGLHWKRTRALMSPTFTSGKIRRMFRFLDGCANDLVLNFKEKLNQAKDDNKIVVVDVKEQYNLYTMDAIATCCYGLKLERATSENKKNTKEDFMQEAVKVFNFNLVRFAISFTMPKSLLRSVGFSVAPDHEVEPLAGKIRKLVNLRRESKQKKFDDYLQLLIDAKLDDKLELDEMDSVENHHIAQTHDSLLKEQNQLLEDIGDESSSKAKLTDFEIISNALTLMVVGLETTSTLLTHCTYALAFYQEIQEKLYDEVSRISTTYFDEGKKRKQFRFEFESLTSCKYLDSVISETLRLLSPVIQIDRGSVADYHMEKYNLDLPKGSKIFLAFYGIHNNPEFWPEPEKFDPERFSLENRNKIVPGTYCPFGIGPRHCLGMRFSLTESKLALAKLIMNFKFHPAPNTVFPPEPKNLFGLFNIKTPYVSITSRL